MTTELPNHIIYWNGTTYKTLQNLVTRISMEDRYLFTRDGNFNESAPGSMGVYFTSMPAIDLAPIVEQIALRHAPTRPTIVWYYQPNPEQKEQIKTWRAAFRADLRAAIEPITPLNYKG